MRWVFRGLAVTAALLGVWYGVVYWMMTRPPLEFAAMWAKTPAPLKRIVPFPKIWAPARAGQLRVGDDAPDFELPYQDGSGAMRLSDLRGRPVVLVFGSYT
jgi:hypothetical protein